MKVRELLPLGHDGPPEDEQLFGIEIEIENVQDVIRSPLWSAERDGSLRNGGVEYITPPLSLADAQEALRVYYDHPYRQAYRTSCRTGMHIHADMRKRSTEQLEYLLYAYALVEPVLFQNHYTMARAQSPFCIPMHKLGYLLSAVSSRLSMDLAEYTVEEKRSFLRQYLHELPKYTALNVNSIPRFGTVEFRAAPTYNELGEATAYLQQVAKLVDIQEDASVEALEAMADEDLPAALQYVLKRRATPAEVSLVGASDSMAPLANLVHTRTVDQWAGGQIPGLPPRGDGYVPRGKARKLRHPEPRGAMDIEEEIPQFRDA